MVKFHRPYSSTCQDVCGSLSRADSWRHLVTMFDNVKYVNHVKYVNQIGKDAKRGILLDEECQVDIESAFYRETVAKKYASLFHSTLHHNTGYFIQVTYFEGTFHRPKSHEWGKFAPTTSFDQFFYAFVYIFRNFHYVCYLDSM